MDTVTQAMQQAMVNQYFRLATTELEAWGRPASLLRSDRIAEAEEERAERDALLKFENQRAALAA
mgnify:CR=1 FL=1